MVAKRKGADRRAPDPWRDGVDSTLKFLREGHDRHDGILKEQTEMLRDGRFLMEGLAEGQQAIKDTLDKQVAPVLLELQPIVVGVKVAKKGGRMAWAGSVVAGKAYKLAAMVGGSFGFVMAILHRESIGEAVAAFWRAFK